MEVIVVLLAEVNTVIARVNMAEGCHLLIHDVITLDEDLLGAGRACRSLRDGILAIHLDIGKPATGLYFQFFELLIFICFLLR